MSGTVCLKRKWFEIYFLEHALYLYSSPTPGILDLWAAITTLAMTGLMMRYAIVLLEGQKNRIALTKGCSSCYRS